MSEKTEKATPYKLQKAKEKGQVNKSNELTICLSLLIFLGVISALWTKQLGIIKSLLRHLFYLSAHMQFSLNNIHHLQQFILMQLINLWLPFAMASGLAIVLINIAQSGMVWSFKPLAPDFNRLNITHGCKKLFSIKTCFETFKNTLKLLSTFLFLFFVLKHQLSKIVSMSLMPISQYPSFIMYFLLKLMFQLIILLLSMALIDKLYTRWSYAKDQRMSKQEIKDEYKQREGDPKVKSKIRQLQQQLRQKTSSLKQIKTADVIITNPTHLAIALKYDKGSMPAPQVVCKAQGEMVRQVKKLASKYSVPIIENKNFARMLYHSVELNQWIKQEFYPIAASIFREIYTCRREVL